MVTDSLADLFQALADPTRLRLVNLVAEGEICVCFLVEVLGEPQPKISRHLAYLRNAGIVEARRDGKWIHYRLAEASSPLVREVLGAVTAAMAGEKELQRDRAALARACCSTRVPATLRRAPRPQLAQ
ncbi:MAG: ArsR/SmtB family transcription factor [Thermoanaerobaculia bacterium]